MVRAPGIGLCLTFAIALVFAACEDGGPPARTVTPTIFPSPMPLATLGPEEYNRLLQEDHAKPRFEGDLAGLELVSGEHWAAQGNSACASRSLEAPYLWPAAFSIRAEAVPAVTVAGRRLDARTCRDAGVTALAYIDNSFLLVLTDSPQRWLVDAPRERVATGTIGGRLAVLISPVVPGQSQDAEVVVATGFGVLAVERASTLEAAKAVAEQVEFGEVTIPRGKDVFTGSVNGVRFYSALTGDFLSREDCPFDPMGTLPGDPAVLPPGSALEVLPSYLPAGATQRHARSTSCGSRQVAQAEYDLLPSGFTVTRFTGEPAWYSMRSEDWFSPLSIDGRQGVLVTPPEWAEVDDYSTVIVVEDFGASVIQGTLAVDELERIALGLNR